MKLLSRLSPATKNVPSGTLVAGGAGIQIGRTFRDGQSIRAKATPEGACITEWYYLLLYILCGCVLGREEEEKDGPPAPSQYLRFPFVFTGPGRRLESAR